MTTALAHGRSAFIVKDGAIRIISADFSWLSQPIKAIPINNSNEMLLIISKPTNHPTNKNPVTQTKTNRYTEDGNSNLLKI